MRFLIPTAAMITLAACSTSSGDDTDTDTSSSGLTVGSVAKEECAGDSGDATCGGTEGLTATDSGGGVVHVVDAGVHLTCCVDVLGAAATSDGTLTVTYTETGDACDCTCYHVLEYDISGVAAGTWTIVAGDHSGDVTVGG